MFLDKKLFAIGLLQVVALLPALDKLDKLSKGGHLFFGGEHNIVQDTLLSVISEIFVYQLFAYQDVCLLVVFGVLLLAGLLVSKKEEIIGFLTVSTVVVMALPTFLNIVLGVKYPLERTGIYWVLIFGMYILLIIGHLQKNDGSMKKWLSKGFIAVLVCVASIATIGFVQSIQFTYYPTNKRDADLVKMLQRLEQEIDNTKTYQLGIDWTFEPTINYYRETHRLNWLPQVTRAGLEGDYDFFYIKNSSRDNINAPCVELVESFEATRTQLLKNCGK